MQPSKITVQQAKAIVYARLGRKPLDHFEAAVILEAWAGLSSDQSLKIAAELMAELDAEAKHEPSSSTRVKHAKGVKDVWTQGIALIIAVIGVAAWSSPISEAFDQSVVTGAIKLSLPITIGVQWALRSRYLQHPDGLSVLAAHRFVVYPTFISLLVLLYIPFGDVGMLAALFVAIWVSGSIQIRRGWALLYVLLIIATSCILVFGISPIPTLFFVTSLSLVLSWLALNQLPKVAGENWSPFIIPTMIGFGLGSMLVVDPSISWSANDATAALALLPSLVGGIWAGHSLWSLETEMNTDLSGRPLTEGDKAIKLKSARKVFFGALLKLGIASIVGSAILIVIHDQIGGSGGNGTGVFIAFTLIAYVTLFVGLLDSLSYSLAALGLIIVGLGVETIIHIDAISRIPENTQLIGIGLIIGSACSALLAMLILYLIFRRPGRLVATRLWIR